MEKLSILAFSFSVNVLNRVDFRFLRLHIKSYGKMPTKTQHIKKIGYLTEYSAFHVYAFYLTAMNLCLDGCVMYAQYSYKA